jgi:hypothetical protein
VAGTLLSGQAGLGLNFNLVDVRITPYADGGYNVYQASGTKGFPWFGEVGARVSKALGAHTFTWVSLGVDAPQKSQVFGAGVGFTW